MNQEAIPKWELAWPEVAFNIGFKGAEFTVKFKPYRAYDLKQFLNEEYVSRATYSPDYVESTIAGESKEAKTFFKTYFVKAQDLVRKADGMKGPEDPAMVLDWIKARMPGYESALIRACFGGFAEVSEENESDDFFSLDPTDKSILRQFVFVPELKQGEFATVTMTHSLKLTGTHHAMFQQATATSKMHRKKGYFERPINHDLIEQIYNQAIQTVEGMTITGLPCQPDNREAWAPLVPYWHKLAVVRTSFAEIEGKN